MKMLPLIAFALAASAAQAQDSGAVPPEPQAVPPASPANPGEANPQPAVPPAAQDTLPPAQDTAAPPAAEAAPQVDVVTSAQVTDAEVDSYAAARVKVQDILADGSLSTEDRQTRMVAAVTAAGIDPQRFNAITKSIANDAELRARVQTAMAAKSAAAPEQG